MYALEGRIFDIFSMHLDTKSTHDLSRRWILRWLNLIQSDVQTVQTEFETHSIGTRMFRRISLKTFRNYF